MEVFMRNISFTVTPDQLTEEISKILHQNPAYIKFNNVNRLNFKVFLHKQRYKGNRRAYNGGTGTLTLPSKEVGELFLLEYGDEKPQKYISIGSRRVIFRKSNKEPRPEVLRSIISTPYIDTNNTNAQPERRNVYDTVVHVSSIQFGWECRDFVFSPEWEGKYPNKNICKLCIDDEKRQLKLEIFKLRSSGVCDSQYVVIPLTYIDDIYTSGIGSEHAIIMILNTPPTYESHLEFEELNPNELFHCFFPIRPRRISYLNGDENHKRVAPYTGLAIRIVCFDSKDMINFNHLLKKKRVKTPTEFYYPVEKRNLFSKEILDSIQLWLRRLSKTAWYISFQLDALLKNWILDGRELLSLKEEIKNSIRIYGVRHTSEVIQYFHTQLADVWYSNEMQPLHGNILLQFQACQRTFKPRIKRKNNPDENKLFECFHLCVTPTSFHLTGPVIEQSNRIIRSFPQHQDRFLRVTFSDEVYLQYRHDPDTDIRVFLKDRVGGFLKNGLTIGGRSFEFLAYSNSGLKEHSVWFVSPFKVIVDGNETPVNASTIISGIGSFRKLKFDPKLDHCPARLGARIAQAFTTTDDAVSIQLENAKVIPDITRNGSCFTDGVGTMSSQLSKEIWDTLGLKGDPGPVQVRFAGMKGMLSIDYTLEGRMLYIRKSMIKFLGKNPYPVQLEIAQVFNEPSQMYLNRPLIMLLEGLGVQKQVFMDLQRKAMADVKDCTTSLRKMASLLDSYGLGTSFRLSSILGNLAKLGIDLKDSVYTTLLDIAQNHVLRELKYHARIPVPGWNLVGVADVHGYLKEGEVFACIQNPGSAPHYLLGPVLISRSPVIHPGDVQVVRAIGPPPPNSPFEKEQHRNAVVFSTQGKRSLPSCLGGGDLDGDIYNVTDFLPLHPPHGRLAEPAPYEAAKRRELPRPCTMADVADFVVEYIISDTIGVIASNWLLTADKSQQGIFDPDCLKLAQLHSDAVDYPKTGLPVAINQIPRLREKVKPDWYAPEVTFSNSQMSFYESQRALGLLYRRIKLPDFDSLNIRTTYSDDDDEEGILASMRSLSIEEERRISEIYQKLHAEVSKYITVDTDTDSMQDVFKEYAAKLRSICQKNTLSRSRWGELTEEEALIGTIVAKCSQHRRRSDLMSKLRDDTKILVGEVKRFIAEDDSATPKDKLKHAWEALELAVIQRRKDMYGARSFWWICLNILFDCIREAEEENREERIALQRRN